MSLLKQTGFDYLHFFGRYCHRKILMGQYVFVKKISYRTRTLNTSCFSIIINVLNGYTVRHTVHTVSKSWEIELVRHCAGTRESGRISIGSRGSETGLAFLWPGFSGVSLEMLFFERSTSITTTLRPSASRGENREKVVGVHAYAWRGFLEVRRPPKCM